MIEYIAAASGNRCVRINNHEHTDVQEYTGSYVADEHGHLVFKEGTCCVILISAGRNKACYLLICYLSHILIGCLVCSQEYFRAKWSILEYSMR